MKTWLLCLLILFVPAVSRAQSANDEAALTAIPDAFVDAWNRHDGHALAVLAEPDVDFVTVDGKWMRGQKDFETYHTRILGTRFRNSVNRVTGTNVRFLSPDTASIHYTWQITGAIDDAGKPVPARSGIMVLIARKQHGQWLISVAQNTNAAPPRGEGRDIVSPLALQP
ncbi:MAG: SgcJ/EcaC family oxidoreductase [Luteibacter sp.]